jgi:hypothetical protein
MALTDSSSPSHAPPVVAASASAAAAAAAVGVVVVLVRVVFGIASNGALTISTDLFLRSFRLLCFSSSEGLVEAPKAGLLSWKQSKGGNSRERANQKWRGGELVGEERNRSVVVVFCKYPSIHPSIQPSVLWIFLEGEWFEFWLGICFWGLGKRSPPQHGGETVG